MSHEFPTFFGSSVARFLLFRTIWMIGCQICLPLTWLMEGVAKLRRPLLNQRWCRWPCRPNRSRLPRKKQRPFGDRNCHRQQKTLKILRDSWWWLVDFLCWLLAVQWFIDIHWLIGFRSYQMAIMLMRFWIIDARLGGDRGTSQGNSEFFASHLEAIDHWSLQQGRDMHMPPGKLTARTWNSGVGRWFISFWGCYPPWQVRAETPPWN